MRSYLLKTIAATTTVLLTTVVTFAETVPIQYDKITWTYRHFSNVFRSIFVFLIGVVGLIPHHLYRPGIPVSSVNLNSIQLDPLFHIAGKRCSSLAGPTCISDKFLSGVVSPYYINPGLGGFIGRIESVAGFGSGSSVLLVEVVRYMI